MILHPTRSIQPDRILSVLETVEVQKLHRESGTHWPENGRTERRKHAGFRNLPVNNPNLFRIKPHTALLYSYSPYLRTDLDTPALLEYNRLTPGKTLMNVRREVLREVQWKKTQSDNKNGELLFLLSVCLLLPVGVRNLRVSAFIPLFFDVKEMANVLIYCLSFEVEQLLD